MHGGSPKTHGNKHGRKHGIYETGVHPEEHAVLEEIHQRNATSLDEEIEMTRLRLRRIYAAQAQWEAQHHLLAADGAGNELPVMEQEDEVGRRPGPDGGTSEYANRKIIRRRTDFGPEIRATSRLLAELIRTKITMEAITHGEEARDQIAAYMRAASDVAQADLENGAVHAEAEAEQPLEPPEASEASAEEEPCSDPS